MAIFIFALCDSRTFPEGSEQNLRFLHSFSPKTGIILLTMRTLRFIALTVLMVWFHSSNLSAKVQRKCVSAEGHQSYVASAKTGGLVWASVDKVGVYEEFMKAPNYELLTYLYVWNIIGSPDGDKFVLFEGGNARVYNFSDYKKIKSISTKPIKEWSRLSWVWMNGSNDVVFVLSKKEILGIGRLDMMTGAGVVLPVGQSAGYKSSAFNAAVSQSAIGFADGRIEVYSIREGKLLHRYNAHNNEIWSLAFHPKQNVIASTGGDGRTVFYDLDKGQTLSVLPVSGHFLSFTSDGLKLIFADYEKLGLYDLQGKPIETIASSSSGGWSYFQVVEKLKRVYVNDSDTICWNQFEEWDAVPESSSTPLTAQESMFQGKPLSHYIQELQKNDVTARLMALQALAQLGPPAKAAIPAMLQLWDLKEGETEGFWRTSIVQVFAAIGPEAAEMVPKMIEALKNPNALDRRSVAMALSQMRSAAKQVVSALIQLTNDPDTMVREAAILALGEIGPDAREAIPTLKLLKKEKNNLIKFRAEDAIKKIEGKW
ncbi:HEAT repeat domain-containing protein [bacterium]|nr:HEAT repeat domain-containing protein [bacterium]